MLRPSTSGAVAITPSHTLRYYTQMPKPELTDIAAKVVDESPRALRLYDGALTAWVPKSQVEDNGDGTFTMPLWLAKEKGFI